jgi:hypothetical protein
LIKIGNFSTKSLFLKLKALEKERQKVAELEKSDKQPNAHFRCAFKNEGRL